MKFTTTSRIAIPVFVVGSAVLITLLPTFPMVTVPNLCGGVVDCVGYASLSCVMFGVGGLDFNSHFYLSAGAGCHLTEKEAGISGITTNTTVTSNLGDD